MNQFLNLIKNTKIPQTHKDIIVGTILGDGNIIPSKKSETAMLSFEQGLKNKEYLYFLFNIMKDYINYLEPKETVRNDTRNNSNSYSYYFTTKSLPIFYPYSKLFLLEEDGKYKKIIPSCLSDLLTPIALAFWIMEDGQYVKRGGLTLCTENFSYNEVILLKAILEKKYDLKCSIQNLEKNYFRIYVLGQSLPLLRSLVSKYMHPSMLYKINY